MSILRKAAQDVIDCVDSPYIPDEIRMVDVNRIKALREALQADHIVDANKMVQSVDALIAEIDGLDRIDFDEGGCDYPCSDGDNYRFDDVRAVLDKYRSKPC